MKTVVNIRGLLCIFAVAFITVVVIWSLFDGFAANKLISLAVCLCLLGCSFAVFPFYASVTKDDITIVYIFGIKRYARWNQVETIARTKGLYKDYFIYPMYAKKNDVVDTKARKVDFPASRRLGNLIEEYWWGKISK